MRHRTRLGLMLASLALIATAMATVLLYLPARQQLLRAIESKTLSIATSAAAVVDGDDHERVAQGGPGAAEARARIEHELTLVRDANRRKDVHVDYIYTAVPVRHHPGRLAEVVDAGPPSGGRDRMSPDLAAQDRGRIDRVGVEELKTDAYGTWVTGYAPVRNHEGKVVASLVVDVEARDLVSQLRRLMLSGLISAGGAFAVALGLALPLARLVTGPLETTVATMERVAAGDLEAQAVPRGADEIRRVALALNALVPRLRDHLRLQQSVHLAQEVQRSLMPSDFPPVARFDLAGKSVYCDEIGGDYYDVVDLSRDGVSRLGVVVGDVTGHGIPAALLMATARALLRAEAMAGKGPADVLTAVNTAICRDRFRDQFMTLFFLVVDCGTLSLRWASAGHEPAILYDPSTDTFEEFGGEDLPLGVRPDWMFRDKERAGWRSGQVLLIGTDGIWETRNEAGVMFGREALREIVRTHADRTPGEILAAVLDALRGFRGERAQQDDVTLVVLKA